MILVMGATGNVGRELVGELLARGQHVRALTRDPDTARLPAEVETVRGDPSDVDALVGALDGTDAAFLNVFGDPGPVVTALDEVSTARLVLLSSLCVETRVDLAYAREFRTTEDRLRHRRRDLVCLRPGQFMSNTLSWSPMISRGHVEAPYADVHIPVIDPADIAAAAAVVLTEDGHAGQTYPLSGGEAPTPRERVRVIARVLDREITFSEQSEEQFRRANHGMPPELLDYLIAMTGHPHQEEQELLPTVRELVGREPRGFEQWVRLHQDELAGRSR